jgi:pimeloyl-ACP methyl ester carboxylesterase
MAGRVQAATVRRPGFSIQRYRVVLFDQHGCGKSTPSASDDDATPALTDNTTQRLIDDVSALRHELNINGKMHVFGGSWGSTLALAYAIAHPATVQTLILRGVFLCRRADVDYFFQGNAAEFAADPFAMPKPGAYLDFPTAWRHFVDVIPTEDRRGVPCSRDQPFEEKAPAGSFHSIGRHAGESAAGACQRDPGHRRRLVFATPARPRGVKPGGAGDLRRRLRRARRRGNGDHARCAEHFRQDRANDDRCGVAFGYLRDGECRRQ